MAKRYLTPLSKQEMRKSNTTYRVTTKYGTNEYDDISEVVVFLGMNRVEDFTVIQGEDNDITDIIQSILIWRK